MARNANNASRQEEHMMTNKCQASKDKKNNSNKNVNR